MAHDEPSTSAPLIPRKVKRMQRTLITIFGTLAAAAVVAIGGAYAFVLSGIYDVSATKPDSGLVYWVTHQTMEHSVARRLSANTVPAGLDAPGQIAAGGALYVANCAVCHGGPGLAPTAISKGLNPQPPDLFRATREPDAAENFQFIKHGVKMTGMPGFAPTKTDGEIWSLVAFLNVAPGIKPEVFARLTAKATASIELSAPALATSK